MSLVGPRPALPSEAEQCGDDVARACWSSPESPGSGKSAAAPTCPGRTASGWISYYVENWSFAGDIQILWKTMSAVLTSRGAY